MAWKEDVRMTQNSMWSKFWRLEGQHTGGIGIWDEPYPYMSSGENGYTVVVRDRADDVVSTIEDIPTHKEAVKTAKELMKKMSTPRKFCNYIVKHGGYCEED